MVSNQVLISRELNGAIIRQRTKDSYFNASDLLVAGNEWREKNNLRKVAIHDYTKLQCTQEFFEALREAESGKEIWIKGKGGRCKNNDTKGVWVHPLAFIDFALWINPTFKIIVYKWIQDKLVDNRCDSGDSFLEMRNALYNLSNDDIDFTKFIIITCNRIKKACNHKGDWNSASEQQLKLRDTIHNEIIKLCNVFDDPKKIVDIVLKMNGVKELK